MIGSVDEWWSGMPRIRWAQRCTAHRVDHEPCRRWSARGAYVCPKHGGGLRLTRDRARERLAELVIRREMDAAVLRWMAARAEFQLERIVITAELMGVPVREVTPALIGWCRAEHGRPAPAAEAPTIDRWMHHMTERYLRHPR